MIKVRVVNIVAWLIIGGALALTGLIAFWLLFPYKPLAILNQPFEIMDPQHPGLVMIDPEHVPQLRAGDLLVYHIDYCKYDNTPTRVTRSFVDGIKYDLPTVTADNPSGCHEIFPSIIVPNIPPGIYQITTVYDKDVNPIRSWSLKATTASFEIIN